MHANDIRTDINSALCDYNARVELNNRLLTIEDTCPRQQALSHAIDSQILKTICEESHNIYTQAHLNLTTASGAGSWLNSIPSKALGMHIDPSLYRTTILRWLRVPLFESEFHCTLCDEVVDRFGDHCLVCSVGGDRTKRHNLIRNEVYHQCCSAGLNPELERPGLLRPRPLFGSTHESGDVRDPNTDRRPADVYLPRWKRGTPAALDLAVTSGLRRDLIESSALDGSSAVSIYEDFKRTHLNTETACLEEGIQFIPLICEADGGGWGPAGHAVWKELAKHKSLLTGEPASITAGHLLQSLGLILHRENARAILRRFPKTNHENNGDHRVLLAASAACGTSADL